ncbi:MAG: energy-coupling factor ABC transporter ATP-binding protein [Proteobacteria bacterium]|nr:energy-coupling factor ABC transporter ATP-binding protein [Pseudomonadota bacterium]
MSALYELRDVVQEHGGREVLRVDHMDIESGCILGICGHNGSGKSTLLSLLAFLQPTHSGTIKYRGKLSTPGTPDIRREITLLTQEPYLLKRTVASNVGYGLAVRGIVHSETQVREALALVGLSPDDFYGRNWRELSGGEAQRVALAARLVLKPRVLLLDEPTSNLDPESTERIRDAALAARENGATLVVVSHDRDWLEAVSDRLIRLANGRVTNTSATS